MVHNTVKLVFLRPPATAITATAVTATMTSAKAGISGDLNDAGRQILNVRPQHDVEHMIHPGEDEPDPTCLFGYCTGGGVEGGRLGPGCGQSIHFHKVTTVAS